MSWGLKSNPAGLIGHICYTSLIGQDVSRSNLSLGKWKIFKTIGAQIKSELLFVFKSVSLSRFPIWPDPNCFMKISISQIGKKYWYLSVAEHKQGSQKPLQYQIKLNATPPLNCEAVEHFFPNLKIMPVFLVGSQMSESEFGWC